ncbi:cardiac-enriched FHL2-interacting protein [Heteronotia binoei]|uniref:cardiac-enriched FHL2-interacting protein n=1 Tax=Heteronotia binoei TaxID=13085 RepID=UPI002931E0BB|nr:cardiac-enriched FHL2-interacting protein [Heteronotia binoei]
MQGNKKHTDGQSDSSSIGSLLDETDREVCSLTDRAFKSLCLDELELSYTEAGPVVSPGIQHPFSSKYFQGPRNHALKKHIAPNKLLPQTEEHSTFQQLPKDTQEEKGAVANSIPNIRRKLGLPVPNLRHCKHTSKVSSLIKTFDKGENQEAPAQAAQPVKNHLPKCPPVCGASMALWGSKMILNFPKELSGFSGAGQHVGDGPTRHEMHKRHHNPMDLLCPGPPHFHPVLAVTSHIPHSNISTFSKKIMQKRIGKAKEPAGRGSFLHSENSAFESWNAHHKKLAGMRGSTEWMPAEENLAYLEDTPCFKESYMLDCQPSPLETANSVVLEQDVSSDAFPQKPLSLISLSPVSLCQSPCLPLSTARDPLAQPPSPPPSSGIAMAVDRIPTPPSLPFKAPFPRVLSPQVVPSPVATAKAPIPLLYVPQPPLPSEANSHNAGTHRPQATLHPEKKNHLGRDPELGKVCPPWRRQRTVLGEMEEAAAVAHEGLEIKDSVQGNSSDAPSSADVATADFHVTLSDASSPSFNITQLLTPLIPPKQEKEPPEMATPPLPAAEAAKEPEERALHSSQNNYKSKASSLLFNLKDIRKRVKSTYSPSPLRKAFEDKKIKEPDGLKASVKNLLEESSSKSAENDEANQKPSGEMGSAQGKARAALLKGHLPGNHRTLSSPPSKADPSGDQKRNHLQQENLMDFEDGELVTVVEFPPKDHSPARDPPSPRSEQDRHLQNASLRDPQNKKGTQSHGVDVGPQESPSLFFTAEENMNDSENRACPESGTEHKDKRSSSSSEQSFVSIIDQPSHEESFSLMQLFQKACLQESQRNMDKGSVEEKPSNKEEEEKSGRQEEASQDLSNDDLSPDGKSDGKVEQSQVEEETVQERLWGERREGKGQSLDSASEGRLEEPLTPTSSSSFKPHLFKIKDNTFKSPPVIKAVRLPLFRSLSCDGAIAGGSRESERLACGPFQTTPVIQETDWPLPRNRRQQRTWRAAAATAREGEESGESPARVGGQRAGEGKLVAESTLQEPLSSFYEQQPVEDDEGMAVPQGTGQNKHKDHEKRLRGDKEKARTRKPRPSSASQLHLDGDFARNETPSPTREKANYYKNNLLSKRRSGSCEKKVITRESRSPTASEIQAYSPAFSDAFRDSLCATSLSSSTAPSPRSDSTMQSAFTSPMSDAAATCSTEKTAASSSLPRGMYREDAPSAAETSEPMQMSQLSGHTDGSSVTSERTQLIRQMVKTAAKPPAVPPKTEKALRRAKKLASRRKKETQQKKPTAESLPPCDDITPVPLAQTPLLPTRLSSPVMPSKSNQVALPPIPSSPLPSPATQRKLLQDPDSGEYFMVDLPTQFKTLFDPESGRYIQVSLPSSKRNLSQTPSSEALAPPYVLYPNVLPLRVSSVPARASPSQLSEPASLVQGALSESASDWQQEGCHPASLNSQHYLASVAPEDPTQEADGPPFSFERDKTDIISLGAIEDFAIEGIS